MPELPEVETVVRGLQPLLVGQRLQSVVARRADLRWPLPADLGERLSGAVVLAITRRAKYGLMETDTGDTLLFHLGMSGKFRPLTGDPAPHDHILFMTDHVRLAYHDPRRFGSMHMVATADAAGHRLLAGLGPEPLGDDFHGAALARSAAGRITSIKALLLDQRVVAGIGNIYASEALFRAGIHPLTPAGTIPPARLWRLAESVRAVLVDAIGAGGSSLRDHAQVSGDMGYFQHRFTVYGRQGQACHQCGSMVERMVQNGRSSFFCPDCQPGSGRRT